MAESLGHRSHFGSRYHIVTCHALSFFVFGSAISVRSEALFQRVFRSGLRRCFKAQVSQDKLNECFGDSRFVEILGCFWFIAAFGLKRQWDFRCFGIPLRRGDLAVCRFWRVLAFFVGFWVVVFVWEVANKTRDLKMGKISYLRLNSGERLKSGEMQGSRCRGDLETCFGNVSKSDSASN